MTADRGIKARLEAGYQPLDAIKPETGQIFEVYVSPQRMKAVARRGVHAVMEMAYVVSEVLARPRRVYEGIRWDSDSDTGTASDDWLCYVGRPSCDFRTPGSKEPSDPRPGRILLVFVNADRVAYNWRWEQVAEGTDDQPIGSEGPGEPRFKRRVL